MKEVIEQKAIQLRVRGKSIKEIARQLGVSQSTASRWCKDVKLTISQRRHLDDRRRKAGIAALRPWIEHNQELKRKDTVKQHKDGIRDIGTLSKRDLFILGIGLYWGEGYKRGNQEWGFTNSDPFIIRVILSWLQRCYGVDKDRVLARLTINKIYVSEVNRITHYWAKEVGLPLTSFAKPSIISSYGKLRRNPKAYTGTLRIKVRNGTSLRRRILASIEAAGSQTI